MSGNYRKVIGPARTRLVNYVNEVVQNKAANAYNNIQTIQFEIDRLQRVCDLIEGYNDKWLQLMSNIPEKEAAAEETTYFKEFAEGDNGYLELLQKGYEAINYLNAELRAVKAANQATTNVSPSTGNIPLTSTPPAAAYYPTFYFADNEIPTWDGNVFKAQEFQQIFDADVDSNPMIPTIRKFIKLKSCLTGEAAAAIAGLTLNESNYDVAREILKSQFGQTSAVRAALFTKLKNLTPSNNSTKALRDMYQQITCICRQLMSLDEDVDHHLMLSTIIGKFPEPVMLLLETIKPIESWKYKDLMEKLNNHITAKEHVQRLHAESNTPAAAKEQSAVFAIKAQNNNNKSQRPKNLNNSNASSPSKPDNPANGRSRNKPPHHGCFLCGNKHWIKDCDAYPTGPERTARLAELGRCYVCLRKNHEAKDCPLERQCPHCGKKHHESVCWSYYPQKKTAPTARRNVHKPQQQQQQQPKPINKSNTNAVTSQPATVYQPQHYANPYTYAPAGYQSPSPYAYAQVGQPHNYAPTPPPFSPFAPIAYHPPSNNAAAPTAPTAPPATVRQQRGQAPASASIISSTTDTEAANDDDSKQQTLLLTAKCRIINPHAPENSIVATVFFDCGSQKSFIHEKLKAELQLPTVNNSPSIIHTFGSDVGHTLNTPTVPFAIATTDGALINVEAQSVKKLIQPIQSINLSNADLQVITRAEYLVAERTEPDILIGNDFFWQFIKPESIYQLPSGFFWVDSRVGPMITGKGNLVHHSPVSCYTVMTTLTSTIEAEDEKERTDATLQTLQQLEDLDVLGIKDDPYADENAEAEKLLDEQIEVVDGRYQVPWLWKNKNPNLSTNYYMAFNQLKTMLNRIRNSPNAKTLIDQYVNYFKELFDLHIIEIAPDLEMPLVYLPHHIVFKDSSETTKFRVVFNGSAKSNGGESLNENLFAGPIKIPDLAGILLRFRERQFVIIADLEKAFLQVGLKPEDRNTTCFLWLKDPNAPVTKDNIIIYRFTRVAFGIISSAYLLAAVIAYHLKKYGTPLSSEILQSIYIDNILFSAATTEEGIDKYHESINLFASAQMNLRQHISNSPEINHYIAQRQPLPKGPHKILGIHWDVLTDCMIMNSLKRPDDYDVWTKRLILKIIAQVFDPIGYLCPVHLKSKIFFQSLWKKDYSWDQPLKEEDVTTWLSILDETCGATVQIPRYINANMGPEENLIYELHGFFDASKDAFALVFYVKIISAHGTKIVFLLAKARLAPSKGLSIPRLELLATYIGVKAAKFIVREMNIKFSRVIFWIDAYCVLWWIKSKKQQKRFVENRLKEIRSFPDAIFRYVPTKLNPADLATRGVPAIDIEHLLLWWNGPEFLENELLWPPMPSIDEPPPGIEEPQSMIVENITSETLPLPIGDFIHMEKFNSLDSLLLTTCFVIKFILLLGESRITFLKHLINLDKFPLTANGFSAEHYRIAASLLVRIVQSYYTPSLNECKTLRLFVDHNGIIRCQTRVRFYAPGDIRNCPIFLPRKSKLTELMILHYHKIFAHCGAAQVLANIRKTYWIPKARNVVRMCILNQCYKCRRVNAKPYSYPPMAELPEQRLHPSKPFQYIGLDMLGPITIKTNEKVKVWICLLTCLTTRAIHLEYVSDLSASSFLNCLRRFFARRGLAEHIISDNAAQFVLTAKAVQAAYPGKIKWQFNVPLAPWQGGIFERLVAMVKNAFRRAIGRRILELEEFRTFICEVECAINTRPITTVDSDINSSTVLRPIDFLILEFSDPTLDIQEDNNDPEYLPPDISSKEALVQRWKLSLTHLQRLWNFWTTDYLTLLRERMQATLKGKRSQHKTQPLVDEIVIVEDEDLPRSLWKLARIIALHISPDGECRSATVRFQNGHELKRPVNLLYPLEIRDKDESDEATTVTVITGNNNAANSAYPSSTNSSSLMFSKKSAYLSLLIVMMLFPVVTAGKYNHKCQADDFLMKRMDIQDCAIHAMAVMQKLDGNLCWQMVTCSVGNETIGKRCEQNCTCPSWSEGCSFYNGIHTAESTITRQETREALAAEAPDVCSFTPSDECAPDPFLGRFSKVILYDNTSHIVKELHLLRKEFSPEEFSCVGEGDIIGSPRFCDLFPCQPTGTKFCYYKKSEAIYLVTENENILIKEWGTVMLSYYKHKASPNENSDCSSCSLVCTTNGVQIKLESNIGNMKVCHGTICHHKAHPDRVEDVTLPNEVLLTTHRIKATFWSNGFVIKKLMTTCPPKNICSLIKCSLCWEIIGNPQCMPTEAVIATAGLIYLILMIIHYLIKFIKRSAKLAKLIMDSLMFILRLLTRILLFLKQVLVKFIRYICNLTSYRNRPPPLIPLHENVPRRHNPFLFVPRTPTDYTLTVVTIACIIVYIQGCADISSISATTKTCYVNGNYVSCTFNQQTLLSLSPQGQEHCMVLKNDDENMGLLKFKVSKIAAYCKPKTEYFTREYLIKSKSSKRCRTAGSCHDDVCEETELQSKITELNGEPNESPGYSYCAASCGCITCSCFFCSSACLFWRHYAIPRSEKVYEIFSCSAWEIKLNVEMTIQVENSTETHIFTLIPGQTSSWNHIKLTLTSASVPVIPALQNKFITDYKRIAIVEASAPGAQIPGTIGDFQCKNFEDAKSFRCHYPPNACNCITTETRAKCDCPSDQLQKTFDNGDKLLPVEIGGNVFEGWERTVRALYSSTSAVQLQLQINGYNVTTLISKSKCFVKFQKLIGCYSCDPGAEVETMCKTNHGNALANINCDGTTAAIKCNPSGYIEKLNLHFNHAIISTKCKITCPDGDTEAPIEGELAFVGHDVHPSYSRIPGDEAKIVSNMDFMFLLNWFSLKQHLIPFIIALIIIPLLAWLIIKNLPMIRAAKLIASVAAKKQL